MNPVHLTKGRHGDSIQTFTGRQFWPLDPLPDEIDIADIAHALSLICRYTGHCREFYSIAQHSYLVSIYCGGSAADQLWGLLHDASEAYISDLNAPVKRHMIEYQRVERTLMQAISLHYQLPLPVPKCVKEVDYILLHTEQRDLMAPTTWWSLQDEVLLPQTIVPVAPQIAEIIFLERYNELMALRAQDLCNN
jgi:hypothetical protein